MDYRPVSNGKNIPFEPIDPDFTESIEHLIGNSGTINFFSFDEEIQDIKGKFSNITRDGFISYVVIDEHTALRADRIITLFGKPGPSYEKYNHFSNICFSCFDEGQF